MLALSSQAIDLGVMQPDRVHAVQTPGLAGRRLTDKGKSLVPLEV